MRELLQSLAMASDHLAKLQEVWGVQGSMSFANNDHINFPTVFRIRKRLKIKTFAKNCEEGNKLVQGLAEHLPPPVNVDGRIMLEEIGTGRQKDLPEKPSERLVTEKALH